MPACAIPPADRRQQARRVGNDLVKHYGKKPYYTLLEVRNANRRQGIDIDVVCWSYALFTAHSDFDSYHRSLGETCDYAAIKGEMLAAVGGAGSDASVFDLDLSWLEFPDLDWSLFDVLDFS